jgi:hypothetical protein
VSTRATVHFEWPDGRCAAVVYRHSDGYPKGLGKDLRQFLREVEEQTSGTLAGTRFDDPSYLAARWVVWDAAHHASGDRPLALLGVGVVLKDPPDIEYRYHIICVADACEQFGGVPRIRCEHIRG